MAGKSSKDVILTPASIFYAPIGTTLPLETLAAGAAWPAGWVDLGYTTEPSEVNYSFEVTKIEVEQALAPLRVYKEKEEVTVETVLAQHSGLNISLALGGKLTTTPAAIGTPGSEKVTFGGNVAIPEYLFGLEGSYVDGSNTFPVRVILYKASAAEGGKFAFAKKEVAGVPLKITGIADGTRAIDDQCFQWYRITAPALT